MKKILVMLLLVSLAITGCGNKEENKKEKDDKSLALVDDANLIVESSFMAYEYVQTNDSIKINDKESACFSLAWLANNGYVSGEYFKGYTGSVLVSYKKDRYVYNYWLSDGESMAENALYESDDIDIKKASTASESCGNAKALRCSATGTDKGECK